MIEQDLEKIKEQYQNTELPQYLIYNGWADLKFKLPLQQNKFWKVYLGRGLIFASICILLTTSVFGVAQAAKPGDFLFPVKTFTEDVKAKISGNYQEKVEKRAQDVIDLSSKSQDKLDKAIEEYKKTVNDGLENTKDNQKYDDLNKTIERQNEQIKKIEENELNRPNIDENNINNSEVKGEKNTNEESSDSNDKNQNQENKSR